MYMELPTYISSAWFWLSLRRVVARYQLCSLVPHSLTVLRRPPRLLTIRFSLYTCHVSNFLVTSLPLRRPASSCSYILYILRIPPSHPPFSYSVLLHCFSSCTASRRSLGFDPPCSLVHSLTFRPMLLRFSRAQVRQGRPQDCGLHAEGGGLHGSGNSRRGDGTVIKIGRR